MNYYRQCLIRISNNSLFLTWIYLHEIEKTERMKERKTRGIWNNDGSKIKKDMETQRVKIEKKFWSSMKRWREKDKRKTQKQNNDITNTVKYCR